MGPEVRYCYDRPDHIVLGEDCLERKVFKALGWKSHQVLGACELFCGSPEDNAERGMDDGGLACELLRLFV